MFQLGPYCLVDWRMQSRAGTVASEDKELDETQVPITCLIPPTNYFIAPHPIK